MDDPRTVYVVQAFRGIRLEAGHKQHRQNRTGKNMGVVLILCVQHIQALECVHG